MALIEEHNIGIIFGCESHIDQSFSFSEVFPSKFTIYRKDRSIGGGVFLFVSNSLDMLEQPNLQVEAELVWARIFFRGKQSVFICSFYRPPDNSLNPLIQLRQSLDQLISEMTFPFIILAGDISIYLISHGMMDMVLSIPIQFMELKSIHIFRYNK